ncbi:phospholipid-transporting ATPase 1 [Epithele typhae]|uniref:phospholipid-transporting ATPase 1 n=1 Tax=Epithele typhae TaxID=378194 RepID=UPI002007BF95|nr:phospholipid-transporting ATPase 1 [Epithele typhae]KAH9913676.1 phospholipid-transporting ATPase 1 [Epithele typhae]
MAPFSRHHDEDTDEDDSVDPELRLRTVRTAASTIAESIRQEQRAERRKSVRKKGSRFFRRDKKKDVQPAPTGTAAPHVAGRRRNVYVNVNLPMNEVDNRGEPIARYARNKVRTSKYTIITFVPKNLYEQFRRVANLYFLALVIVQVFSVFGAPSPQTSALPLIFILTVTMIKDGVEDYRRAMVDDEVNNSAVTRLGNWRNVNQPQDPRAWYQKMLGVRAPDKVTRGVKKLREREASEGKQIVMSKDPGEDRNSMSTLPANNNNSMELGFYGAGGKLDDIQSIDSHSYPPADPAAGNTTSWGGSTSGSFTAYQQSIHPPAATGVVDYSKRTPGLAHWERTLWKKLEVGDIVLLRDNEQVPADLVVLATSDADNMCYLETKNLDGETNLKPRKAVRATAAMTSEEDIERSSFILDSEPPHANLYLYHGVLRYKDPASGEPKLDTVTINELLLRGCTLRNTAWVVGLVVFTGADSKIMLNGGDTPSKRSKIEKETNFNVIVNFLLLVIMCLSSAILNGYFDSKSDTSADFFEQGAEASHSNVLNAAITFVSCLIAFQNIVPISLYISIEIVKTIQAYFISQDIDMYYQPFDATCTPKTWNISDDLGQIEYVFSDKTGTLTQNIMEFQKCSINGVAYGEGVTEAQRGAAKREGKVESMSPEEQDIQLQISKRQMLEKMSQAFKNRYAQPDHLTLVSPRLADDLADRTSPQRQYLIDFFRALAVCHSVLSDRSDQNQPFKLEYKAESPDEAALVAAARDVGFPFANKSKDAIDIEVMGQPERYIPLQMLEFNSTRKRMSVVVRNPQGQLILYCKGADSVIYQRLRADHDPELKAATARDMEAFANGGLRTLCIAYRTLSEQEYMDWVRVFEAAQNSTTDRDEEIDKANEKIEHSLTILGATALEDKLQEGVPEAIQTLHRAGIKLWILTGDKVQTAIEIGFSCNLLKSDMEIMILSADTLEAARLQIEGGLNKIASVLGPPSMDPERRGFVPGAQAAFAVVIDGDTLRHALGKELKQLFLTLSTQCETVVCCRVSPAQKALVVNLVKEGRNAMTLSIGDGANDVAMIQEANIGCGLLGYEGSQAAMSADYAFGQFRFLTKLLLVHGRWSYQRVADMHANFFYKNVIWTFAMFWFMIFNNFDATYLYQYTFILLCNLVFTSLPVIVLGAFDQDINAKAALAFPQLYIRGIRGLEYTKLKFWMYMLDGLYQSAVVFFIPYFIWQVGIATSWNGRTIESLSDFGTTVSVAAIICANTYVGLNTHYWTVITWIIVFGSSLIMLAWIAIYSLFESSDFVDEVVILFGDVTFWGAVLLSVIIALGPRFFIKYFKSTYMPLDKDIIREKWVAGDLKDQLGITHRRERKKTTKAEQAPMFHNPHYRSESELSQPDEYGTPQGYTPPTAHTPNMDGSPRTTVPLMAGESPRQLEDGYRSANPSPIPSPNSNRGQYTASPNSQRLSYYSASNIPPPSPLPESNQFHPYTHHSSARNTAYGSEPHMSAVSHTSVTYNGPPSPHHNNYMTPPGSATLQVPGIRSPQRSPTTPPEQFEMRVRSPPHSGEQWAGYPQEGQRTQPDRLSPMGQGLHTPMATEDSYATARTGSDDDAYDGFDVVTPVAPPHAHTHEQQQQTQTQAQDGSWRNSTFSYSGPHAI